MYLLPVHIGFDVSCREFDHVSWGHIGYHLVKRTNAYTRILMKRAYRPGTRIDTESTDIEMAPYAKNLQLLFIFRVIQHSRHNTFDSRYIAQHNKHARSFFWLWFGFQLNYDRAGIQFSITMKSLFDWMWKNCKKLKFCTLDDQNCDVRNFCWSKNRRFFEGLWIWNIFFFHFQTQLRRWAALQKHRS